MLCANRIGTIALIPAVRFMISTVAVPAIAEQDYRKLLDGMRNISTECHRRSCRLGNAGVGKYGEGGNPITIFSNTCVAQTTGSSVTFCRNVAHSIEKLPIILFRDRRHRNS